MARVLVIEDDRSIAMLLALVLGHEGHEVEICADGAAAIARLDGEPADAVVTDVMLPSDESGLDVIAELRSRPAWSLVPAIVISALAEDGAQWDGWRAGATGYLVKPFDADELVELLHDQLTEAESGEHDVRRAIPTT